MSALPYKVAHFFITLRSRIKNVWLIFEISISRTCLSNYFCLFFQGPVTTTQAPSTPTVSRVGCYHDFGFINGRRPFPLRGDLSNMAVKTSNINEVISHYYDVVNQCASLARKNGFKVFVIINFTFIYFLQRFCDFVCGWKSQTFNCIWCQNYA